MSLAAAADSEAVHVLAQASGGGLRYALCDVTPLVLAVVRL